MSSNTKALNAAIAATRFGLGARPGEIAEATDDPQGWLAAQIRLEGADLFPGAAADGVYRQFRDLRVRVKALQEEFGRRRGAKAVGMQAGSAASMQENAAAPAPRRGDRHRTTEGDPSMMRSATDGAMAGTTMSDAPAQDAAVDAFKQKRKGLYKPLNEQSQAEIFARFQLACATRAAFRERWALFWSNHFSVSVKSEELRLLAPVFEREAIRPHVFGRFEDLLVASSTHPAMISYLDQQRSVGPDSPTIKSALPGQGARARGGLNENLAREILELHTVGADGGYSQADVTEFARALTGWGIATGQGADGQATGGLAIFRDSRHQPGARTVMGRTYRHEGQDQAKAILVDLASMPQTAHRLCGKLAIHFVSDTYDPTLAARLEDAWRRSSGDLSQVALALVRAPEAWQPQPLKLKTPYEFVVSGFRAAGSAPQNANRDLFEPLTALGHRPFAAPQPNGWPDEAAAWAAPDSIVKRLTWAQDFASRYGTDGDVASFAQVALGARLSLATVQSLARAESRAEAVTLLLMSPEFQRR